MKRAIAASLILLSSAMAASAQTSGADPDTVRSVAPSNQSSPAASNQANAAVSAPLRQQVRDNLVSAGFSDIQIMPTSFLVRAKDKSGNPVMMVINPDSVTELATVPGGSQSSPQSQQ